MSVSFPFHVTLALLLLVLATFTDWLDGKIARERGLITDFGKLMDPLADKILTASAFILLVSSGAFPAWIAIVMVAREFLITGLRILASSKGIVLPAEKLGKHKTAWQMIAILYFLLIGAVGEWLHWSDASRDVAWHQVGGVLISVAVILTVYSGIAYLLKHRDLWTNSL
jgi:CDP-diacylglycerol--glycerol-3-phosphate 3-phosphatidyltransferase